MRYTVTKQRLDIIGYLWQPGCGVCAQSRDLTDYDLNNIGDVKDREAVARWTVRHCGDFSEVIDFRADFHPADDSHVMHEWARGDESACAFLDAMYPEEED